MSDVDGLRREIAEALPTERMWLFDGPHDYPTLDERLRSAAAVLPVVTAWAERQARERAAEELRAAAEDRTTVSKLTPVESLTCFIVKLEDLFRRAAALADDGRA